MNGSLTLKNYFKISITLEKRTKTLPVLAVGLSLVVFSCSNPTENSSEFTLTTTVSPSEAGQVSPMQGTYNQGQELSLEASAYEGWVFSHWEQDITAADNPVHVTMNQDYEVVAVFEQAEEDWLRDTETEVVDVTNPATGKIWMDRNLGASRAATSSTDSQAYGDLYQWGRAADGHEKRNSATTSVLSNTNQPGHDEFIMGSDDWLNTENNNLWQGVNGINNPCPDGYRLPTEAEWDEERQSWSSDNADGAFASPLKLTLTGIRDTNDGSIGLAGTYGIYSSSTLRGSETRHLSINSWTAGIFTDYRAYGRPVRCIKD